MEALSSFLCAIDSSMGMPRKSMRREQGGEVVDFVRLSSITMQSCCLPLTDTAWR